MKTGCLTKHRGLRLALTAGAALSGLALAGCMNSMSSPTYGTGVRADQQLMSDVSNIFTVGPQSKPKIAYEPRPALVKPAPGQAVALPAPQQNVATASNPNWPESPEARRARIRQAGTDNQNNPFFRPETTPDTQVASVKGPSREDRMSPRALDSGLTLATTPDQREEYNKRLAMNNQGDPKTRNFLSDPPLAYRQPADSAPADDIGEDEWKKEKRLKAEARRKSGKGTGWFDWLPGM